MRPVSPAFLDAISGSHTMAVRLRAVPSGQTGVQPTGGVELRVQEGDVQQDGRADIRATLDCRVAAVDPVTGFEFWPRAADDPLTPYGAYELFVERGVAYGRNEIEYVSLGYFRIDNVEQPSAPDGPISLTGSDRMSMIIDSDLTSPRQFRPTDSYGYVVEQLVLDAYLDAVIEWDDDDVAGDAIGRTANVEQDRYAFLRELIVGLGKIFYFDHRGVLVIRTPPDPGRPLWTVSRGESGVLVSAGRSLSREGVFNGVLATGEALDTEPPVRGLAVDNNPDSPTYWSGPFGRVTREFASPLLTTTAQCVLAASTILRRSMGLPYNVDVSAVPNPALEPDDPIAIGFEGAPVVVEPELIVGDSFSRTVVDGPGVTESGHGWSAPTGTTPAIQVANGVLTRALDPNTVAFLLNTSATGQRDFDAAVDIMAPAAGVTGEPLVFGIMGRYSSDAGYMNGRFEFVPGGTTTIKISVHDNVAGYSEPVVLNGFGTFTPGQWFTVRVRARGDVYEIKAWPRDEAEPHEWSARYVGANVISGATNRFGMYFWRLTSNTNAAPQYTVDNWRVYNVPTETLRGGEVHVLDTLTIPLTAGGAMRGTTREQTVSAIGVM